MAVSDQTRKKLWALSGNQCALCRTSLVAPGGHAADPLHTVLGEEAHIHGRRPTAARYDSSLSPEQVDGYANLILLCATHHKLVDDRPNEYPASGLRHLKERHEGRVAGLLRARGNTWPLTAEPITSGTQLLNVVWGAEAYQFDHDEPRTEEDADAIASFLQLAHDLGEVSGDLPVGAKAREGYRLNGDVQGLISAGYAIFGIQSPRTMNGGSWDPIELKVAFLVIKRTEDLRAGPSGVDQ